MSMIRYRWRPLDKARQEIRVLDLDPGAGDTPLKGQLRHVFLGESDKPHYETISYAWDDTALVSSITVDGHRVSIPASAASALRCMRSRCVVRALWIDCICIDQDDDRKKGHQVGLMANVFQNARRTLAFLGDHDDTTKHAFDSLNVVCDALINSGSGSTSWMPEEIVKLQIWASIYDKIHLPAIIRILEKKYFT